MTSLGLAPPTAHLIPPVDDQPGLVSVQTFITSVRDVRYTQLVSFVTATIVIYDYIVCLEREVELIWKKRWSVIKLAFLWHRYFGVVCVLFQAYALNSTFIDDKFCTFWFYWETWGYCVVLFTSEAVLLLWIYVVYNKNRWILALMGTCYAAEVAGVVTILTISFENFKANAHGIPGLQYCVMTDIGKPFPLLWVPILGYDSLLLLLFLYRGCAGASPFPTWRWAYSYDGLLDMIYRHSLLNFLAIFASYLACAIIWLTSNLGLYQIPVSFALSLSITNCTRLLLNIRRAYYSGVSDPLLFNIRELPDETRHNTPLPHVIDVPMSLLSPISPISGWLASSASSGISGLSGPTLRDPDVTPTSTVRMATASPASTLTVRGVPGLGHEHEREDDHRGRARAPMGALRALAAGPRPAHECVHEPMPTACVSAEADAGWWHTGQYELGEMRVADPRIAYGEAV